MPSVPTPTGDKRWKIVEVALRRHGYKPAALVEGMHLIQQTFGYLDKPSLRYLAETLSLPLAKVWGVATFYHHFTLRPPAKHTCVVCLGTVCHLKGGPAIVQVLSKAHRVRVGGSSPGGEIALLQARCVGACSLAPVVVLDGAVKGKVTPEQALETTSSWFGRSDSPDEVEP